MKKIYILSVILFSISFFIHLYFFEFKYSNHNFNKEKYTVVVLDKMKETKNYNSYLVLLNNDRFLLNIYDTNNNYLNKDILLIKSYISIPDTKNNLYEFNYKRYLNSEGIIGILNTSSAIKINSKLTLFRYIQSFREYLDFDISKKFNSKFASFLKTIIYSESINDDILEEFTSIGINHVLSISGFNIYILSSILKFLLKKIKSRKIKLIIKSILFMLYLILCSFKISLLRSVIYNIIIEIQYIRKVKVNKVKILIAIALLFLIYNPYIIFSASYILSFLASFSIAIFTPIFYSYIDYKTNKNRNLNKKILIKILRNIATFVSVQILILPVQVVYFNQISLISLLSNILLLPIVSVQLALAMFYIPFHNIYLLEYLNKLNLKLLFYISNKFREISIEITCSSPTIYFLILYYLLVFIIVYKKVIIYKFKLNKKIIIVLKYIILIYMLIEILYLNCYINFAYHFNVGQGNMSLVKFNNTSVLLDCGSVTDRRASSYLIYLTKALNIYEIDCLVISHFHEDHINALEKILENRKINYVMYQEPRNNLDISKYKKIFIKYGVKEINIGDRDIIDIGNINIDIYSPKNLINTDNILNSNCMISLVTYNNKYNLFMGDSTKETEIDYIESIKKYENKNDYIYKLNNLNSIVIGHHGSRTSTGEILMNNIDFNMAVISSVRYKYGHPNEETIDILNKFDKKYFIISDKNKGLMIK